MSYPPVRYEATEGTTAATFRAATDARDLDNPAGGGVAYLASAALTDGDYGLFRWDMGAAPSGPAPHFHRSITESFFVLNGTVRLYDGTGWIDARPGDFLFVPEGGVHGFRNNSSEPSSMLILFAPGAPREGYFEAIAERAAGRSYSDEEWRAVCERHDNYFLP